MFESRLGISPETRAFINLLEALATSSRLNAREVIALSGLAIGCNCYDEDDVIIEQGASVKSLHLVRSGWACVYRDIASGDRQIIDFPMRCDFFGLRNADGYSYNTVSAITPMEIFEVPLDSLQSVIKRAPGLALILIELMSRQRALLIEHVTSLGRRSALARTGHFLLELSDRVKLGGTDNPDMFYCPITQYQLADALGLTPIHLNRMLRELRESQLVRFRANKVEILNRGRLKAISDYDGEFLNMTVFSAAV